jgi:hypothetical protein
VVAVFLLGLSACSRCASGSSECPYVVFDDVEVARSNGAFERGWLPDWLPNEATEIHEFHDLDTNAQAITFSIERIPEFDWPSECTQATTASRPRLKTEKFPNAVHQRSDVQDCDGLFGVKEESGLVHLWRP